MGTAALSERDYVHRAVDRADLIVSIGHDTPLEAAFKAGGVHLVTVSVDYSENMRVLVEELRDPPPATR